MISSQSNISNETESFINNTGVSNNKKFFSFLFGGSGNNKPNDIENSNEEDENNNSKEKVLENEQEEIENNLDNDIEEVGNNSVEEVGNNSVEEVGNNLENVIEGDIEEVGKDLDNLAEGSEDDMNNLDEDVENELDKEIENNESDNEIENNESDNEIENNEENDEYDNIAAQIIEDEIEKEYDDDLNVINVNNLFNDVEYNTIVNIEVKQEDERIYTDNEEIENMITDFINKLPPVLQKNELLIQKIKKKVEILNYLKNLFTDYDSNYEPIGIKNIDNTKPLLDDIKMNKFNRSWLLPVSINKNKLYSAEQEDLEFQSNPDDPSSFYTVSLDDELNDVEKIMKDFDKSELTFINMKNRMNILTKNLKKSNYIRGNKSNVNINTEIQRFCDNDYICNYICDDDSDMVVNQNIIKKLLEPEYIFEETILDRGDSTLIETVLNNKIPIVEGDEINIVGLVQYPYKLNDIDINDCVYDFDEIIKKSKKMKSKSVIYNKLSKTGNIEVKTLNNKTYSVGDEVMLCDDNFLHLSEQIIGEIESIDEVNMKLILKVPNNPNNISQKIFEKYNNLIYDINDKYIKINDGTEECLSDIMNDKDILYYYPQGNSIELDIHYEQFLNGYIPSTFNLLLNIEEKQTNKILKLSDIEEILYKYNIDANKIDINTFNQLDAIINQNFENIWQKNNSNKIILNKYKRLIENNNIKIGKEKTKILPKLYENKLYNSYKYSNNIGDSLELRTKWLLNQNDNSKLYIIDKVIENYSENLKQLNEQGINAELKKLDKSIEDKLKKYEKIKAMSNYFNKKSDCDKYILSKIYDSSEDLKKDNNINGLLVDYYLDDTPLYLRDEVIKQHKTLNQEQTKVFIIDKLRILNNSLDETELSIMADNVLNGGKYVNIGDYALLRNKNSYNVYTRKLFEDKEIWILENSTLLQKIINDNKSICYSNGELTVLNLNDDGCIFQPNKPEQYYTSRGEKMNNSLVEESGIKGKFKNTGKCLPAKAYKLEKEIVKTMESKENYLSILENIKNNEEYLQELNKKREVIIEDLNYYNMKEKYTEDEYYRLYKDTDVAENIIIDCKHNKYLNYINKTVNLEHKTSMLFKFFNKFKSSDIDESNPYLVKCVYCKEHLYCQHEIDYIKMEYNSSNDIDMDKFIKKYGILDSEGIICKYCGKKLLDHENDDMEGFKDGIPILTRDNLEENDTDGFDLKKTLIKPQEFSILSIIHNILNELKLNNILSDKEKYSIIVDSLHYISITKDNKNVNTYNSNQIFIISVLLLLRLQTLTSKKINLKKTIYNCLISLDGYPLNDNNKHGLEYFANILGNLTISNNDFKYILENLVEQKGEKNRGKLIKKIVPICLKSLENIISKLKLLEEPRFKKMVEDKIEHDEENQLDYEVYEEWNNFLPPLSFKEEDVFNISKNSIKNSITKIYNKEKINTEDLNEIVKMYDELGKKNNKLSYNILSEVNKSISQEELTGNNVLVSSCCIQDIKNYDIMNHLNEKYGIDISSKIDDMFEIEKDSIQLKNIRNNPMLLTNEFNISRFTVDERSYSTELTKQIFEKLHLTYCYEGISVGQKHEFYLEKTDVYDSNYNEKAYKRCILSNQSITDIEEYIKSSFDPTTLYSYIKNLKNKIIELNTVTYNNDYKIPTFQDIVKDLIIDYDKTLKKDASYFEEKLIVYDDTIDINNIFNKNINILVDKLNIYDDMEKDIEIEDKIRYQETIWNLFNLNNNNIILNIENIIKQFLDQEKTSIFIENLNNIEDLTFKNDDSFEFSEHILKNNITITFKYILSKLKNSQELFESFKEDYLVPEIESVIYKRIQENIDKINEYNVNNISFENEKINQEKYRELLIKMIKITNNNFKIINRIFGSNDIEIKENLIKSNFNISNSRSIIKYLFNYNILSLLQLYNNEELCIDLEEFDRNTILETIISIINLVLTQISEKINRIDFNSEQMIENLEKIKEKEKVKIIQKVDNMKKHPEEYKIYNELNRLGLNTLFQDTIDPDKVDDNFEKEKMDDENQQLIGMGVDLLVNENDGEESRIEYQGEDAE